MTIWKSTLRFGPSVFNRFGLALVEVLQEIDWQNLSLFYFLHVIGLFHDGWCVLCQQFAYHRKLEYNSHVCDGDPGFSCVHAACFRNGMLGEGYSSKLSPWLALGCISPRRIWSEVRGNFSSFGFFFHRCPLSPFQAKRYETERRIQNKSTYWPLRFADFMGITDRQKDSWSIMKFWKMADADQWMRLIFELTWRDFFIYMAWSQGFSQRTFFNTRTQNPWQILCDFFCVCVCVCVLDVQQEIRSSFPVEWLVTGVPGCLNEPMRSKRT